MAKGQKSAAKYFSRVEAGHVTDTDNFSVDASCIGCGKCESICPADSIQVTDGRPHWVSDRCAVCFGCLRICPTESITYGRP